MGNSFTVQNPDFDSVVRDSIARQPFMDTVGAKILDLQPGICELAVEKLPGLLQQHGFFHGGVVASLADSAAGYAAYSLFPAGSTILTVDYKVNFLNPASGTRLIATGSVIKPGRKLYFCKADVVVEADGQRTQCVTGLFTMMCLMGKKDSTNLGREETAQ